MDHLKARTRRNISQLKEKLPSYNIEITEGDLSGPDISFLPPKRQLIINYPPYSASHTRYLPINEIPEEFKIIYRVNNALMCSDAIEDGGFKRPFPKEFLETKYDVNRGELLEKNKFAEEIFKFPLINVNETQLREIPHFYRIDKEIKYVLFDRYAERNLRELKKALKSEYVGPEREYTKYSKARVDLRIYHDLARSEPYDFDMPVEYYRTAGDRLEYGKKLLEEQKDMNCETFEDVVNLIDKWLKEFNFQDDFEWVRSIQIS
ncbi:MAG: hypothetical protein ABEK17_03135 [Candidatus Aenigmatarchaeota archaeon]